VFILDAPVHRTPARLLFPRFYCMSLSSVSFHISLCFGSLFIRLFCSSFLTSLHCCVFFLVDAGGCSIPARMSFPRFAAAGHLVGGQVWVCMCLCVCVCVDRYTCKDVYTCMYMYMCILFTYICIYVHLYLYVHMRIHIYMYIYIYVYRHIMQRYKLYIFIHI